jgi:hypothetical protein
MLVKDHVFNKLITNLYRSMGSEGRAPLLLSSILHRVSSQLHAAADLSPRMRPGTAWIGDWMGPRAGLDGVEYRKIFPLPGIKPYSFSPAATPTEISWLLTMLI